MREIVKMDRLTSLNETEVSDVLNTIPSVGELISIYSEALDSRNTIVAVAAQEELYSRGALDRIIGCLREVTIELNTEFSEAVSLSLMNLGVAPNKHISIKDLMDGTELPSCEREADDETKELLRRYGKYIKFEKNVSATT